MTTRSVLTLPGSDLAVSLTFYLDRLQFKLATHTLNTDIAELIDPNGDQLSAPCLIASSLDHFLLHLLSLP